MTALIPYTAAWLSYRGAITSANSYGQALSAWVDLNRFKLYETLRMPSPSDSEAEKAQNIGLAKLVLGIPLSFAQYQHPASTGDPPPAVMP